MCHGTRIVSVWQSQPTPMTHQQTVVVKHFRFLETLREAADAICQETGGGTAAERMFSFLRPLFVRFWRGQVWCDEVGGEFVVSISVSSRDKDVQH